MPIVAAVGAAVAERGAPPERAIGYFIGGMLFPALIALAVVKFKPAKRMRTFSTVFLCIGLLGLGGIASSLRHRLLFSQKTPKEIAQEAAGTKPVTESGDPSEQGVNRVLREFMSDMLAARRKHDADAAPLAPVLATLFTAQSFSSAKQMEDITAALKKILQVDGAMVDKIQRLPQEMKARVDASDLSPSDKEDIMRGVQQGYGNSDIVKAYGDVHACEEQWGAASIDLYTFALHHASQIKTADKKIVIADGDLLSQFNAKFSNSRELQKKLSEANQRLTAIQEALMQKTGISKSDLGLK